MKCLKQFQSSVQYFIFTLLELAVSLFLIVLFAPIIFLIFLLNEAFRFLLNLTFNLLTKGNIQLVHEGADALWSFKKPGNSRLNLVLTVFKGDLDVNKYSENFNYHVINYQNSDGTKPYEKLTKIFTKKCGYMCWKKDESFELKNHIKVFSGIDGIVRESDLFAQMSTWANDMDESKPQWEEILIPRFYYDYETDISTAPSKCARLFRVHHAYLDGASMLLLLSHCMYNEKKDGVFPYSINPLEPNKNPAYQTIVYYILSFLFSATTILKNLYVAASTQNQFITKHHSGKKIYSWSQAIDLEMIKEIKVKTKTSLPVILSSILAGSLRKLYEAYPSKRMLELNDESSRKIPEETLLGLVAAMIPYSCNRPRNKFTMANICIPTGAMSRTRRLKTVKTSMNNVVKSPDPIINYLLFKFFGRLPASLIQSILSNTGTPIIFSNCPSAKSKVQLWDMDVLELSAWMPLLTTSGLGVCTMNYGNQIRFCGVAEEACLSEKELHFLLAEVTNEVRLLAQESLDISNANENSAKIKA